MWTQLWMRELDGLGDALLLSHAPLGDGVLLVSLLRSWLVGEGRFVVWPGACRKKKKKKNGYSRRKQVAYPISLYGVD